MAVELTTTTIIIISHREMLARKLSTITIKKKSAGFQHHSFLPSLSVTSFLGTLGGYEAAHYGGALKP